MKLDGEFVFDASVQQVWDALFDPAVLAAALPGCEKLERVDGSYVGELKVKIGPIQGKFTGKVDLLDMVEPTSYRMIVDGRGPQGFVKATASIALSAEGAGTRIRYESEAQVGGKVASVGQRLVETSARAIVKQSLEGLNENIKLRAEAYQAHQAAVVAAPEPVAEVAPVASAAPEAVAQVDAREPAPADEAAASPAPAIEAPAAPVADAVPAPAPEPSAPKPAAPPISTVAAAAIAAPVVNYKKADAGKLAGAVAKEVTKTLAPVIIGVLVAVALAVYLLVR
ncbi:MAG: carbon monoxide dehydrogenase subunit G [Deltaproteobacteria bacterium]|nr:carbon monoxide dehydrogenase subunit G [Deltaproteobacteria bacterium]